MPIARPLPGAEAPFGPTLPNAWSRSALVVSRHLDGFLRAEGRGFVAPRCQSWSSPRFSLVIASVLCQPGGGFGRGTTDQSVPATRFTPFEDFPSPAAAPSHDGRCHLAVTLSPLRRPAPKQRPLPGAPDARGRLGESKRRRSEERGARTRDVEPDSVMLRSAEADPHVTEHEASSARRSRRRRLAQGLSTGPAAEATSWGERPDHRGDWPSQRSAPCPRSASEDASRGAPRPRSRGCRSG
jgi:hypothetical protein